MAYIVCDGDDEFKFSFICLPTLHITLLLSAHSKFCHRHTNTRPLLIISIKINEVIFVY